MPKTYRYRNIILAMYYVLVGVAVLAAATTIAIFFFVQEAFFPFLILDLILGLELWLYQRLRTTQIRVGAEAFEFVNSAKSIFLPYSDILAIETKSVRFAGGWLKIISNRYKPIRIALNIKDGCDLVKELKFKLDELELFDRYDEEKLYRYYQTAVYAEGSWKRLTLLNTVLLLVDAIGTGLVWSSGLILDTYLGINATLTAILFAIVGFVPYFYLELGVFVKQIKNQLWTPEWTIDSGDLAKQRKWMLYCLLWDAVVLTSATLLFVFWI